MKIKINRKKTVLLALALCFFLMFPVVSFAGEKVLIQASRSGSSYFTSDWMDRKTASYDGSTEILDYGFNTFLINEDIAYSYSNSCEHASKITNGTGTHYGQWRWANQWSDLEVRHSGNTVHYYSVMRY
jgi:hypothetical protein